MKTRSIILILLLCAILALTASCGKNSNYEYEKVEGGVKITKYIGEATDVTIPEKIGGKTVVAIGQSAFDAAHIESLVVPKTVTSIEKYAFRRCHDLKSVTLNANIKVLETSLFHYCAHLQEVNIPDTVELIKDNVFGHTGLKSIVIPDSVKEIQEYGFINCYSLESIDSGSGLETIGDYAFSGCVALKNVTLRDQVKNIGKYAFSSCAALTEIDLPESLTVLSEGVLTGAPIKEIFIPRSVKKIETLSLSACEALTNVYITPDTTEFDRNEIFEDSKNVVIRGIRDSAAEIFADSYGFKFEPYEFK